MQANSSRVEFLRTISKFRKGKKTSPSLVHVLHKTWNQAFSRCSLAVAAKKCTKKVCCTWRVVALPVQPTAFLTFSCYPSVKRANAFYAWLGQVVIQSGWLFVFFFQPGEHYVSITNYSPTAEGPEDLPLTTGETVRLLTEDGAWAFVCTLDQSRRRGWVPSSILKKKGGIPLSQR